MTRLTLPASARPVIAAAIGARRKRRRATLMMSANAGMIAVRVPGILGIMLIAALDWSAAAAVLHIALGALFDGAGWMLSAARDRRPTGTAASPPPA